MTKFPSGIQTNNGRASRPAIGFIDEPSTGIFLDSKMRLCLAQRGIKTLSIDNCNFELFRNLKIAKDAIAGATLVSDADGIASWKTTSISGSFPWNSIYKSLNVGTTNNENKIAFTMLSAPIVSLALESNVAIDGFSVYIKNKTCCGMTIYSNSFMTKQIADVTTNYFALCQLLNGNIGTCFYNTDADRIEFVSKSPTTLTDITQAVIIDDTPVAGPCDIATVNDIPAIVYIADSADSDEWRYVSAKDIYGQDWNSPVTILTASTYVHFGNSVVKLIVNDGSQIVFLNDETGAAKAVISSDGGTTWGEPIGVSNLVNHQILDVKVIHGIPAVIAKSNVTNIMYYVRASKTDASSWPIGATQLYRDSETSPGTSPETPMFAKSRDCTLGYVNDTLTIVATENTSNALYIASATDNNGSVWEPFKVLDDDITNEVDTFPCLFRNNNTSYLVYNTFSGLPSEKKLISFDNDGAPSQPRSFISSLDDAGNHQVLPCTSGINIMAISSAEAITMLKFCGDDLVINWGCQLAT
jgi:hypothetical protein